MANKSIRQQIIDNIGNSDSAYRELLAREIIDQSVDIRELMDIILLDHPISTRFTWLLGDLSGMDSSFAPPILTYCHDNLDKIKVKDINRVIAKQCYLAGNHIPDKIEGKLIDHLFEWWTSKKSTISTKHYAKKALYNLCQKYPELKMELDEILKIRNNSS